MTTAFSTPSARSHTADGGRQRPGARTRRLPRRRDRQSGDHGGPSGADGRGRPGHPGAPETSPHDLRGPAAATGVVTARGGPASHAAVVARAMGKPAVVGVAGFTADEGILITIDGTSGEVALGSPRVVTTAADVHLTRLLEWADDVTGGHTSRDEAERLSAAMPHLG